MHLVLRGVDANNCAQRFDQSNFDMLTPPSSASDEGGDDESAFIDGFPGLPDHALGGSYLIVGVLFYGWIWRIIAVAAVAAPKPLSMLTTVKPPAQLAGIQFKAVWPSALTP